MLTERDQLLISMLVWKTRLAMLQQILTVWWGTSESAMRNGHRRIRSLCQSGWLDARQVLARPLLNLSQPLNIWVPGDTAPSFDHLAWQTQSRWKCPARRVTVLAASQRARQMIGGTGRRPLKNICQVTHDLHVTAIYLNYFREHPDLVNAWQGEDGIAVNRRYQVLPDALLVDGEGHAYRAIEFGGSYDAQRLRHFHDGCAERELPYEVW